MLRKIIQVRSEEYLLHIPKEYINKKIEILVLPFENELKSSSQNIIIKTAGIIKNRNIDPIKWQKEIRAEWE